MCCCVYSRNWYQSILVCVHYAHFIFIISCYNGQYNDIMLQTNRTNNTVMYVYSNASSIWCLLGNNEMIMNYNVFVKLVWQHHGKSHK